MGAALSKEPDDELTVGEVARRTGVAVSALHYYEQLGLITSRRTPGTQRRAPSRLPLLGAGAALTVAARRRTVGP